MILPLLVMGPIDAPAPALKIASPGAPLVEPLPPLPPWIVPLLVSVAIVPEFAIPAPPAPPLAPDRPLPPFPPLIVPLLDRLVIVPAFDTPAPPAPPAGAAGAAAAAAVAAADRRAPVLVREPIVACAAFDTPAPPAPKKPLPPLSRELANPNVRDRVGSDEVPPNEV